MKTVDDYLALVPPSNADKPKFIATLRALLEPLVAEQALLLSMIDAFDLGQAVGAQLDADGVRIGRDRQVAIALTSYFSFDIDGLGFDQGFWQGAFDPDTGVSDLDDDTYRLLLQARALANRWDGTRPGAELLYNQLLNPTGQFVQVEDNQDMSMTVRIFGPPLDARSRALIQGGYLGLKPGGVSVTYAFNDFDSVATFTRASRAYAVNLASALVQYEANIPRVF